MGDNRILVKRGSKNGSVVIGVSGAAGEILVNG